MQNIGRSIDQSIRELERARRVLRDMDSAIDDVVGVLRDVSRRGSLEDMAAVVQDAVTTLGQVTKASVDFARTTDEIASLLNSVVEG